MVFDRWSAKCNHLNLLRYQPSLEERRRAAITYFEPAAVFARRRQNMDDSRRLEWLINSGMPEEQVRLCYESVLLVRRYEERQSHRQELVRRSQVPLQQVHAVLRHREDARRCARNRNARTNAQLDEILASVFRRKERDAPKHAILASVCRREELTTGL